MKTRYHWIVLCVMIVFVLAATTGAASEVPPFEEWTFDLGLWEIQGDTLVHNSSSDIFTNTNAYVAYSQEGKKLVYSWRIEFQDAAVQEDPGAGVHILAQDPLMSNSRGNSYLVWQTGKQLVLYRASGKYLGSSVLSIPVGVMVGETHDYRVLVDGEENLIVLYRDGDRVGEWHDPDIYLSGKYLSIRTNRTQAAFSNLTFEAE